MKLDDDVSGHYLNLNFSDQFLNEEHCEFFVELPYPINKPFKSENVDVIETYREKLKNYNSQLLTLNKEFHSKHDQVLEQDFRDTHVTVTQGLLNLCREKPEVPFICDYNPFYASGLLQHFTVNNTVYLVRPDSYNNLRISNLKSLHKSAKLKLETSAAEPITGLSVHTNRSIFLLTRYRDKTNLIRISDVKEPVEVKWTKKFKQSLIDSKCNDAHFGVILANTKFRLYDLETSQKLSFDKSEKNVGISFDFIDHNRISLLGQKSLKIVDQRSGDCKLLTPEVNGCDHLCASKIDDCWVYISTRHFLLRSDIRFEKNVEFCTHFMKQSPCYMGVCDKFLCLSGQNAGEKTLFSGRPIGSLPINVPNVFETLNECKLQKATLLRNDVNQRLEKSIVGVKLISDVNETSLYSANCMGDIFKQRITTDSKLGHEQSLDNMCYWINKCPKTTKPLRLTNAANMSEARFVLNKRIQDKYLVKFTKEPKKAALFLNQFNNMYNKDSLSELATNFLSIWDEEADDEEVKEDVDLVPEVAPLDKVSDWIESNFI